MTIQCREHREQEPGALASDLVGPERDVSWEEDGEDSALGRVRCLGVFCLDVVEGSVEWAGGTTRSQDRHSTSLSSSEQL